MMRRCSSNPIQWCNCADDKPCPTSFTTTDTVTTIEGELRLLNEKINIINDKLKALEESRHDKIREVIRG